MVARGQFVAWFAVPRPEHPGKYDKIPCHWSTGAPCNPLDPANWTDAQAALAMSKAYDRGHGSGIGFVFTEADPFFFVDADGALGPDGQWSPAAQDLCRRFAGCAVEVSHSGRGLHIFGTYQGAAPTHGTRNLDNHLELYTRNRFAALTGIHAQGDAGRDATGELATVAALYFPPTAVGAGQVGEWTVAPVAEWGGPADDDELIRRALAGAARSAKAAFGGGLTFADLWAGDVPHDGRSEADQALANHLAYWTGKDCERIERLMRASGLVREKWDAPGHVNYLRTTILKACAFVGKVATPRETGAPVTPAQQAVAREGAAAPAPAAAVAQDAASGQWGTRDPGREFLGPREQLTHFAGCTYISDLERIYSAARNKLMKREAFDVEYGGHVFVLDAMGQKTVDSAYMALTRSRVNKPAIVDDLCFRPQHPTGAIVREGNYTLVNTYAPYECEATPGDPAPFLDHLARLLPDPGDRASLLQYFARIVQNPGVKVPWWPVIQGVKGNGKSLLATLLTYIFGEQYTHKPNAAALAKDGMKFNKWLLRKTFVVLDEVSLSHKRDFLEEFKPIVTESRVPIEGKGVDQVTGDNAANGVILTNHKDGVPIDDEERRYAIFYTAQQLKADLATDGLTETYFETYRAWVHGPGRAIVAHYLKTLPLPAEMPSRAPQTTSTKAAIYASLGRAEQEVMEAIAEGRIGFLGGFVSSKYLDALLAEHRFNVPRNKRRGMMQALGYDWHPALDGGRLGTVVTPDAGKPILYLRNGHLALSLTTSADIAAAYSRAQSTAAAAKAFNS